ncbi:hypothetical protein ACUSIJ_29540 [Pseudochelatococcus sp. B33]
MPVTVREKNGFSELKDALSVLPLRNGEQEFARIASAFLRRHANRFRFSTRSEPLSQTEANALRSVGATPEADQPDATPLIQTAANHSALVATALPLADAARRLRVTDGRLRQRIGEGSLLAVHGPDGRSLRIPVFQLTETGELPGLRVIMKAMRRELEPVQVAAFFTTPQVDLEDDKGEPMTPVTWLLAGNNPTTVKELARGI